MDNTRNAKTLIAINAILSAITAYFFTLLSSHYANVFWNIPNNAGIWLACWIICCALSYHAHVKNNIRSITCGTIFFTIQLSLAYLSNDTDLSVGRFVIAVLWSIYLSYCISPIINRIRVRVNATISNNQFDQSISIRLLMIRTISLFLLWLPYLLTLYPGVFAVDVPTQVVQHIGTYNTHHPLAHTLLIQVFISIGDLIGNRTLGVCLYNIVQMGVLSFSLSYLLSALDALHINKTVVNLVLAWIGICPIFPTMAVSVTKDVFFAAFYILFVTSLIFLFHDIKTKLIYICLSAGIIGSILFRNNGIYAIIPSAIVATIISQKKCGCSLRIVWTSIAIAIFANFSLIAITKASTPTTNNETLSIPYQQLARTYCYEYESLSEQERSGILKYVPDAGNYNPYISDPVKDTGKASKDYGEFIKNYLHIGVKYPLRYLEAFLCNNDGYLFIDSSSFEKICEPGASDGTVGYLDTSIWTHYGVERTSYLPSLLKLLRKYFVYNKFQDIPAINILFHYSIYIWGDIAIAIYSFYRKKKEYYPVMVSNLVLLFTFFMGPAALLRYILAFIPLGIVLPIVVINDNGQAIANKDGKSW